MEKENYKIILTGAFIGIAAVILVLLGNPANMGFCIACFIRDITGSLELHTIEKLQYARAEIFAIILGAFIVAKANGEYNTTGGSSPIIRFVLGFFIMVGALVFLGCPLRMVLRLGGGDGKAIFALIGFIGGIYVGSKFLGEGFSLGRSYRIERAGGYSFIAIIVFLTILSALGMIGNVDIATHAPFIASFAFAIIVGILAQRTRFCMVGGYRDIFLFKDFKLFWGSLSLFIVVLIGNIITGQFSFSITFTNAIWYLLSMSLVGFAAALAGGCPLRQLILAGEGNTDSMITIIGMIFGAAISHNFSLASSPTTVNPNGKIAVIVGLIIISTIAIVITKQKKEELKKLGL
ncbi:MAG: YedE family putative selenium transporter [Pleomorphochaeta sp.]